MLLKPYRFFLVCSIYKNHKLYLRYIFFLEKVIFIYALRIYIYIYFFLINCKANIQICPLEELKTKIKNNNNLLACCILSLNYF